MRGGHARRPGKLVAVFIAFIHTTAIAQVSAAVGTQAVALMPQPDSPLQILSMQPVAIPSQGPPRVTETMAGYEVVLQNKAMLPVMAYAISHEWQGGTGRSRTCQSSMGFRKPMIGAGETKTIQSQLAKRESPVTPVIDFVLLSDGAYFGKDSCRTLSEYTTRLAQRRATFQTILKRVQAEGVEKTLVWMREELSWDVRPLLTPKKMK